MSSNIPIFKIGDILIATFHSDIDDKFALEFQAKLVEQIYKTKASGVLIDLSVVDMVDSFLGRLISDIAKMSTTLDANTVVVGIQPPIAITLVELGLELSGAHTALNVEHGIEILRKLKTESDKSVGDPKEIR